MEQFYMVYLEGRGGPTHKHETLEEASAEAERLLATHDTIVYILQAVVRGKRATIPVEWEVVT